MVSFRKLRFWLGELMLVNDMRRYRWDRLMDYQRLERAWFEFIDCFSNGDPEQKERRRKNINHALTSLVQSLRTFGNPDSKDVPEEKTNIRDNAENLKQLNRVLIGLRNCAGRLEERTTGDLKERFGEMRVAADNAASLVRRRQFTLQAMPKHRL